MSNEFDDDPALLELDRKFAHVQIAQEEKQSTSNTQFTGQDLAMFVTELKAEANVLYAMNGIRQYLSQDISIQRIQTVLDSNILFNVTKYLMEINNPELQYEAGWILTNLAFGTAEQTNYLISSGVVQALGLCFVASEDFKIKTQTAWAIANISIDAPVYREELANNNFISELANTLICKLRIINPVLTSIQYEEPQVITLMSGENFDDVRNLTWSLANICRGGFKTSEYWSQYIAAFYALTSAVFVDNNQIWTQACWGIARIFSNNYKNDFFFQQLPPLHSLCTRLITMIRTKSEKQVLPILQTICNFSTGPDNVLQTMLDADLLNSLWWFCSPDISFQLRRNAILTVSNLAADLPQMTQRVVDNENIMRTLIYHLCVPGHEYSGLNWKIGEDLRPGSFLEEWKVIKEVMYVFINIMTFGLDDTISILLDNYKNINPSLVHILHYKFIDTKVAIQILDLLTLIIRRTYPMMEENSYNPYINEMIGEGVMLAMSYHFHTFMDLKFADKINDFRYTIQCNGSNLFQENTSQQDATGTNARRIVQGNEDGDIRFLQDAMNSMEL